MVCEHLPSRPGQPPGLSGTRETTGHATHINGFYRARISMGALSETVDPGSLIPLQPRDYLTLFALVQSERHGYGIAKQIEEDSHGQVKIDQANLYRSLKRLRSIGLLEESKTHERDDPTEERRRYYRLTSLGRKVATLEAARLAELTERAMSLELIPAAGD